MSTKIETTVSAACWHMWWHTWQVGAWQPPDAGGGRARGGDNAQG